MSLRNGTLEIPPASGNFEQILIQVERINSSPLFRNSPLLQSFLKTIAEKALADQESEINEYFIATEVFSRMPDFDPSADTIVRTQAYRLRLKLQEYYRTLGQSDRVVIEVPKGHYVPVFRFSEPSGQELPLVEAPKREPVRLLAHRRIARYLVIAVAGVILFLSGRWSATRSSAPSAVLQEKPFSPVERSFWESFLAGDRQPFVAYTNSQFLGNENGDLLRFPGGPVGDRGTQAANPHGPPLYFIDDMTGVGEVSAGVAIANTLGRLGAHPLFKRSRLVTAYDLQSHNVIFLGAPSVNPILNELPKPSGFTFGLANSGSFLWRSRIDNIHPLPGEPAQFTVERDPASHVLRTDYASISLLPGTAPGRRILVLAGLTTSGTQAAAEAVTSTPYVNALLERLNPGTTAVAKNWPDSFQSIWRVDLSRGLDVVQMKLVATRADPPLHSPK